MQDDTTVAKKKATRKLKSFDFSGNDSAVALVGPAVGSAANGAKTVLFKSIKGRSEDFIKKAQGVQVTMELPEFLTRFFNLYGSDAEVLARLMGYVEEDKEEDSYQSYEDWINERVQAIKLLDTLEESTNLAKSLVALTDEEHLSVLKAQEYLEPFVLKAASKIEPTGSTNKKETEMTQQVDTVEKSQFDNIQKALGEKEVALQKALEEIESFKAEKKEAIKKARLDQVKAAVKNDETATVLFKAVGLVDSEEDFVAVVKALSDLQALVEKSALFQEQGASGDAGEEPVQESKVAKAVKARIAAGN